MMIWTRTPYQFYHILMYDMLVSSEWKQRKWDLVIPSNIINPLNQVNQI